MLSRFTWWDLFIVGGIITALYYGYIAVVYYREDIREWWSNKGTKAAPAIAETEEAEPEPELDESMLYSVHSYGGASLAVDQQAPAVHAPPSDLPAAPVAPKTPAEPVIAELDLDGAVVGDQEKDNFNIPVNGSVVRDNEERLEPILTAASRVTKDDAGVAKANDEQDQPAVRIASQINYQAGQAAFADINFNR